MDDIAIIIVISVVALVVILAIGAHLMTRAAELKGYSADEYHIFPICFFLGIMGYLYVIALPDKKMQKQIDSAISPQSEKQSAVVSDELPDL